MEDFISKQDLSAPIVAPVYTTIIINSRNHEILLVELRNET